MFELLNAALNGLLRTVGLTEPPTVQSMANASRRQWDIFVAQHPTALNTSPNDLSLQAIELLRSLRGTGLLTERRGRFIAVAITDFVGPNAWDAETPGDLKLAIRLAVGNATDAERVHALTGRLPWKLPNRQGPHGLAHSLLNGSGVQAAYQTLTYFGHRLPNLHREIGTPGIDQFFRLIDDIFPPREPSVSFEPHWRTTAVTDFARHIASTDDTTAIPILADLLEEAGCDDETILGHCRGPDTHVRGCWVVDQALGKT